MFLDKKLRNLSDFDHLELNSHIFFTNTFETVSSSFESCIIFTVLQKRKKIRFHLANENFGPAFLYRKMHFNFGTDVRKELRLMLRKDLISKSLLTTLSAYNLMISTDRFAYNFVSNTKKLRSVGVLFLES